MYFNFINGTLRPIDSFLKKSHIWIHNQYAIDNNISSIDRISQKTVLLAKIWYIYKYNTLWEQEIILYLISKR